MVLHYEQVQHYVQELAYQYFVFYSIVNHSTLQYHILFYQQLERNVL